MVVSGLMADCSGLIHLNLPKPPFQIQRFNCTRVKDCNTVRLISGEILGRPIRHSLVKRSQFKCTVSAGNNRHELRFDNEFRPEPFWLNLIKEAIWALRSLFVFLVEQPGQLRFIEWPSFQSTLKTATLTLVLVALLIVALASIDSALSYLLALLLRRTA